MYNSLKLLLLASMLCFVVACSSELDDFSPIPAESSVSSTDDGLIEDSEQDIGNNFSSFSFLVDEGRDSIFVDGVPMNWMTYQNKEERYISLADITSVMGILLDLDETAVNMTSHGIEPSFYSNSSDGSVFQKVIDDIILFYGQHELDSQQSSGLYHVEFLDFTGDGNEDLFVSYVSYFDEPMSGILEIRQITEVWTVENKALKKLHEKEIHHVMGGTGAYDFGCELISDGEKSYVAYSELSRHMYFHRDHYEVIDLEMGESIVENLSYDSEASGDTTYFNYILSQNDTILADGTYSSGESYDYGSLYDYLSPQFNQESMIPVYDSYFYEKNLEVLDATSLDLQATEMDSLIYLDETLVDMKIYNINDDIYVNLSDVSSAFGMGYAFDVDANTARLTTDGSEPFISTEAVTLNEQYPNGLVYVGFYGGDIVDSGTHWEIPVTQLDLVKIQKDEFEAIGVGDTLTFSYGFTENTLYSGVISEIEQQGTTDYTAFEMIVDGADRSNWYLEDDFYVISTLYYIPTIYRQIIGDGTILISKNTQLIDDMGSVLGLEKYIENIYDFYGLQYDNYFIDLELSLKNGFVETAFQYYRP